MTRWDHYGFSPIVKTAGRCLSPGRNRRPKSFSLDDEQADHFDVSGLFFRRVQQQVPDIMCDRAPAIGVTGAAICVLILECTNLGRGPRTSVLQFCICLAPIGAVSNNLNPLDILLVLHRGRYRVEQLTITQFANREIRNDRERSQTAAQSASKCYVCKLLELRGNVWAIIGARFLLELGRTPNNRSDGIKKRP